MKKIFILLAGCFCAWGAGFAQTTISYETLRCSRDEAKQLRKLSPEAYTATDNHTYKIGDTLILGEPAAVHTTTQATYSGAITNAEAHYQTIVSDLSTALEILSDEPTYMTNRHGEYFIITKMKIDLPRKNSVDGAVLWLRGKIRGEGTASITDFEAALALGEVRSQGMTRDRAIQKLREAKEELDLEIITQEEYNQLKQELTPYIRK